MTYALRHPHVGERGTGVRAPAAIQWPRNLGTIGLAGLLLSAWGGIVPFVGPAFGFHANASPSWQWSFMHAMLYVVPGAVGVAASLAVIGHTRAVQSRMARMAARFSLGFVGLVLAACAAWFVVGPVAWPALGASGAPFAVTTNSSAQFVNWVGYNLGVGVLLAIISGMVIKASTGERRVAVAEGTGEATATRPAAGGGPDDPSPATFAAPRDAETRAAAPGGPYQSASPVVGHGPGAEPAAEWPEPPTR